MPTPLSFPALRTTSIVAGILAVTMGSACATPFTLTGASTTAQNLAAGQAGSVTASGALAVSGSTVAVTITGSNATLDNQGAIAQTGTGRAIRDNTGVANLVINNGSSTNAQATIRTADNDVIQMNAPAASVVLNNYGALVSLNASNGGAQAVDFSAMTGANTLNNHAGAVITAREADAVRPGANGIVNNAGKIASTTATGSSSDGIDGQNNTGIRVSNSGVVDGGRHGITGGQLNAATAYTMNISNDARGIIRGNNGSGINIDGVNAKATVTVTNRGAIIGNGVTGDGDGVDVDGLVNINNTGVIRSSNAFSAAGSGLAYSEAISAGGGAIVNAGTIEGLVAAGNTNAVGRGITLAGNDVTTGASAGTREGIYGNATITNQSGGLIRGDSDSAIVAQGAASGYTIAVNNNAGATILGGGASNAAIRTVNDRTVINNAGIINGASSGRAIDLSSANNTVIISGGSAQVIGSVSGGAGGTNTMVIDAGAGHTFSYSGALSNFSSVTIQSGAVTLSGQSTYTGQTIIGSGASLTLSGANRIAFDSALVLAGGLLKVVDTAGGGQTFASLSLLDSSTLYFTDAPVTFNSIGTIVAGKTLTLTELSGPGAGLRFLGDLQADAAFLQLVGAINSGAVRVSFDGRYTNVSTVPEPGTLALLAGGLAMLGAGTRRRK